MAVAVAASVVPVRVLVAAAVGTMSRITVIHLPVVLNGLKTYLETSEALVP